MRGIKIELWGERALFSRSEFSVERYTYEVPTPSSIRGLIESIYFHPGLKWIVDRIYVLNPIKFSNIRRNEVKSKILASNVSAVMRGSNESLYINTKSDIQQRASTILRDVRYVVEAHFETIPEKMSATDSEEKFYAIVMRRLQKGQSYSQPYFGNREFPANFKLWEEDEIVTSDELAGKYDLGFMLYDMDYSDLQNIKPIFFHAVMYDGVLDLTNCGVKK